MSRWFRHYAGMMRDEKLVSAALKAKQPVERVVWVWGAILESAAEINDGGRYELDRDECAYFLRVDEGDIAAIEDALSVLGRVREGVVGKWGDRQFQSDRSADRQQRYRERHRQGLDTAGSNDEQPSRDADVTSLSRHGDAPETETELDTEKKEKRLSGAKAPRRSPDDFEDFWKRYPKTPVMSKKQALAEWGKLSSEDHLAALAAVDPFKSWLAKQKDHPVVHACRFLSQRRFEGFGAGPNVLAPADLPGFYASFDSYELVVWDQYERSVGKTTPRDKAGGWRFPSQWPPGHEPRSEAA